MWKARGLIAALFILGLSPHGCAHSVKRAQYDDGQLVPTLASIAPAGDDAYGVTVSKTLARTRAAAHAWMAREVQPLCDGADVATIEGFAEERHAFTGLVRCGGEDDEYYVTPDWLEWDMDMDDDGGSEET